MKILWISSLAWDYSGQYIYPVNGPGAVSGSLFQQSIIEGLEKLGNKIDIICDYPYDGKKIFYPERMWSHRKDSNDIIVESINIPYLSILYKSYSLKKIIRKNISFKDYDVAIAYLIHQPYMDALNLIKKTYPSLSTILICPDLPDMMDMSLSEKKVKSFLKFLDMQRIRQLYNKIDGFVLFAEKMKDHINMNGHSYIVIEGVATLNNLDVTPVIREKYIMYAGTLHKNIGIEEIIESVKYFKDSSIKIKFFGTGELKDYIINESKKNPRIIYEGFVNRIELFEAQKKAMALINARNPQDLYTKYSFPSKTFEYLYSGTPFISTKLEGIPKEYSKYLFEIENNKPQTIAKAVNNLQIEEKQKIVNKCNLARKFVEEKKNKNVQAKLFESYLMKIKE